MGGSEAWFQNYERCYNEREAGELPEDLTDVDLAEMASEREMEDAADLADRLSDEKKEGIA